ncbi:MAG: ParB N-terminal domain-containing protein [Desulfobacterales bacterium]
MRFNEQPLPIESLSLEDAHYRITTSGLIEKLTDSIAALGVIDPPLVCAKAGGYRIVAGFRRIEACRLLGQAEIRARVLPGDSDEVTRVRLAIADNSLQRPLGPIETAHALNLLAKISDSEDALSRHAAALALPANPALMRKIMSLTMLPAGLQARLASGELTLPMALDLRRFDQQTAEALARLFADLKLGLNRQREMLVLVTEIARREQATVVDILADPGLAEILSAPDLERGQKAGRLRDLLRHRRYPVISSTADRFQDLVRELNLGPGVRLVPPVDFEGTTYTMAIGFDRLDQLQARGRQLERVVSSRRFKDFLGE